MVTSGTVQKMVITAPNDAIGIVDTNGTTGTIGNNDGSTE
jgi:hypothetical protein